MSLFNWKPSKNDFEELDITEDDLAVLDSDDVSSVTITATTTDFSDLPYGLEEYLKREEERKHPIDPTKQTMEENIVYILNKVTKLSDDIERIKYTVSSIENFIHSRL